ncbi:MAG TPA: oligosaccharide flippase family protein [Roseateles sp.]|nr:oligosaccharide flippase family protein [Roseateles sp.]HWT53555.1 oligosaccharide flippase family protein [Rhodocyclaceae bacterium]
MRSIRSSLAITFISSNSTTVINFGVNLVLARLLSPEDIGVYSISVVLVAIAHVFREFGVSAYLLREKELTPEKIRSASGVLYACSTSLAVLIFLLASPAAAYYRHPGVEEVMHVLALGFLFIPFGAITSTLLTRELRAKEQAIANAFGTVVFACSSLLFAWLGFRYMTSAWANFLSIVVTGLALAPYRPKTAPWLPSFKGWRKITHFGLGTVLGNSLNEINNALADLMLGRLSTLHHVGLYSRANSLSNMFMQIAGPTVNYASLPYLAKIFHDTGTISKQLSKATAYLSVLAWPALTVITIYARETILFLFGETWLECVPIVAYTTATAAVCVCTHFLSTALIAIGRPYQASLPNLVLIVARIACILLVFNGTLVSFGYGLLLGTAVALLPNLMMQAGILHFSIRDFLTCIAPSLVVTVIVAAATALLKLCVSQAGLGYVWQILLLAPLATLCWYAAIRMVSHPIADEVQLALNRIRRR